MITNLQKNSSIPLLTAVDEEGGKVIRISSNPLLSETKFLSSQELYKQGSFNLIKEDTIKKSKLLSNLGINLNLAPVVDISTNKNDYIYERSLGENANITSIYAKTVIEASHNTNVSYTLKHFPGYSSNLDTHTNSSFDNRTYEDIMNNDILPFKEGIQANAEAIMISHNTVTSIDKDKPASLSKNITNFLKNELNFTGIIITDDLDMGATNKIISSTKKALLAENNLLIVSDYNRIDEIKELYNNGEISEELINKLVFKILAWKYYKNLIQ